MSHGLVELRRCDKTDGERASFDVYCLDGEGWYMGRVVLSVDGGDASFEPTPEAVRIGLVPIPSIMSHVDMSAPNGIPRVLDWPGRGAEIRNMMREVAYALRR